MKQFKKKPNVIKIGLYRLNNSRVSAWLISSKANVLKLIKTLYSMFLVYNPLSFINGRSKPQMLIYILSYYPFLIFSFPPHLSFKHLLVGICAISMTKPRGKYHFNNGI